MIGPQMKKDKCWFKFDLLGNTKIQIQKYKKSMKVSKIWDDSLLNGTDMM